MSYEQEMQQARNVLDKFNSLDDETRDKISNGVEWLAFLQNLTKGKDAPDNAAQNAQPAA